MLAVDCVPGDYPASRDLDPLAQYFHWSAAVLGKAQKLISGAYVAVQVRSEFMWSGRCGGFSCVQCQTLLDQDPSIDPNAICDPGLSAMRNMLNQAMEVANTSRLFVAADVALDQMGEMGEMFLALGAQTQEGGTGVNGLFRPQVDLAILTSARLMIGHCPSSFSNIATRMRAAHGKPSAYWGLPQSIPAKEAFHN